MLLKWMQNWSAKSQAFCKHLHIFFGLLKGLFSPAWVIIYIELPFIFLPLSFLCWGIFGCKSEQCFACWISANDYFIYRTSAICLFSFLFRYCRTAEKELSGHSVNMIYLKIKSLILSSFWLQLPSFFCMQCVKEIIWFLVFKLVFTCVFHFCFLLFSQMLAIIVQEWKFCCIWFQFVLQSQ